ncbi:MAG: GAF domain-containing sensor histidine kinase [Chloroflexi bacterium]|nr:GAF domain-containing sensor histidine kinase [Chloroflexota bacterium]
MARAGDRQLLHAISDAVLAILAERRPERSLRKLIESACSLVGAKYGALGIPDESGEEFRQFIFTGMDDELVARIGPLPRRHGLLAAMLRETGAYRSTDVTKDPRFEWWPDAHPRMRSFLGVPIVSGGSVIAAIYLTDKVDAPEFSDEDQEAIEMLAAHAAVAIENARLHERSRELSAVEERNRLARDLHDSVKQTLFSISLTAEATAQLIEAEPAEAKAQAETLRDLARQAVEEMRSLIFELRPAELESEGLLETLRKHVDVVRRVSRLDVQLRGDTYETLPVDIERQLLRIAQEALSNAVKHAQATSVKLDLGVTDGRVRLSVRDDGRGFDPDEPGIRSKRLGITSMEERAGELGGELSIESTPGQGTIVVVEAPVD